MSTPIADWKRLPNLEGGALRAEVFKAIQRASQLIQTGEKDDPAILEAVPRLVELLSMRSDELASFKEVVSGLARASGLWNYIDKDNADTPDTLVAEAVTSDELGGITFHREQVVALNTILSGKNLILSAPTSFGKSLLIDALLITGRYRRVAIVLPTIALLDEFRRRLLSRFRNSFQLIMHPSEAPGGGPVVFLGTQERLIHREDLGQLDLVVVDEFYKLDPLRKDERSVALNAAVYRLLRRSKQFFFLGPNIDNVAISDNARWRFEFLKTRFSTVAVDTFDLQAVPNKRQRLFDEIGEEDNWPALVFVSSPDRANSLASELADEMAVSDLSSEFAEWLSNNLGPNGLLSRSVHFGFGVHHGRVPRAVAAKMVRMFNEQKLPVLFCTSTLIEGVNTAAKTVMIYDKKINRADYDFFTFANIRGRAGRLGQHHIGRVLVFNEVPAQEALEVAPTVFNEDEELPDEYIVYMEDREAASRSEERVRDLRRQLELDDAELRLLSPIGLESALELKAYTRTALEDGDDLVWTGVPLYRQIEACLSVINRVQKPQAFGAWSTAQLTFYIDQLRRSRSMRAFLLARDRDYKGKPEGHDSIFKFMRACEYGLPQYFTALEIFVRQIQPLADYSLFIGSLSSWFRPEVLKELDEEGVPIQIAERFYLHDDSKTALTSRLETAIAASDERLSPFERQWLSDVLIAR
ncbi:DEAD/DEAH box helicase [Rhizobium sp. NLR9b]|uniref:DEAD/DEAH box helicase n=1 Tax=unclassified Rhizobium TaxID=2613769 RepID=UPI001C838C59|nr:MULTISPECIES: DEAD/DEAH box helicase [unclassified Rhizobium]MBX5230300.1 DEAD/DEAH box helicase [Rhizobium sp. NLR9b]MBX5290969.1 DEAD/DEAH box helicase [Rhizobium sp. NLR10b]